MKTLIGKAICWLLRRHQWRRLRKVERVKIHRDGETLSWSINEANERICDRCGVRRAVKARKAKATV